MRRSSVADIAANSPFEEMEIIAIKKAIENLKDNKRIHWSQIVKELPKVTNIFLIETIKEKQGKEKQLTNVKIK